MTKRIRNCDKLCWDFMCKRNSARIYIYIIYRRIAQTCKLCANICHDETTLVGHWTLHVQHMLRLSMYLQIIKNIILPSLLPILFLCCFFFHLDLTLLLFSKYIAFIRQNNLRCTHAHTTHTHTKCSLASFNSCCLCVCVCVLRLYCSVNCKRTNYIVVYHTCICKKRKGWFQFCCVL